MARNDVPDDDHQRTDRGSDPDIHYRIAVVLTSNKLLDKVKPAPKCRLHIAAILAGSLNSEPAGISIIVVIVATLLGI